MNKLSFLSANEMGMSKWFFQGCVVPYFHVTAFSTTLTAIVCYQAICGIPINMSWPGSTEDNNGGGKEGKRRH